MNVGLLFSVSIVLGLYLLGLGIKEGLICLGREIKEGLNCFSEEVNKKEKLEDLNNKKN